MLYFLRYLRKIFVNLRLFINRKNIILMLIIIDIMLSIAYLIYVSPFSDIILSQTYATIIRPLDQQIRNFISLNSSILGDLHLYLSILDKYKPGFIFILSLLMSLMFFIYCMASVKKSGVRCLFCWARARGIKTFVSGKRCPRCNYQS